MTLNTMEPNPTWGADAYPEVGEAFSALEDDAVVRVWGADWCGDCRSQLPDFAAALEAAGVENVEEYPVERVDGEKVGPKVEAYDVTLIPTIVIERDGEEVARFIEEEPVSPEVYLAEQLSD